MTLSDDEDIAKDNLNPFVCTLGEAAQRNAGRHHPFPTVYDLLEFQASQHPDDFAVGFPVVSSGDDGDSTPDCKLLRYRDLQRLANLAGEYWQQKWTSGGSSRTVALLSRSTFSFLASWLGLVRLGYTVLLLAPQIGVEATDHLCRACDVTQLIYDEKLKDLAQKAAGVSRGRSSMTLYSQPDFLQLFRAEAGRISAEKRPPMWTILTSDTAYIHHSSGTSGNLPKPLPISHQMAVGVLPVPRGNNKRVATFSTTPLYHGGVADCFRAWSASCMIWLFPGESPVTGSNVLKCASIASRASGTLSCPSIHHFSCVPQVLNFVSESSDGMTFLQTMQMVGFGGAPMPEELATRLVDADVNLVSRYGSTECGFLLSSDRVYSNDKAWQFLRQNETWPMRLEPKEDGLSELIVLPTWPGLAHRNRPDGSFATADLFEPHSTIPLAWRFHSRADAQLTLSTGKKFDPAPFEDALRESPLLGDILIFGSDRPFPGALIFRPESREQMDAKDLIASLWPFVQSKNSQAPDHAKLTRSMLIVMPASSPSLEKSAKGTTVRKKAWKTFEREIAEAYEGNFGSPDGVNKDPSREFTKEGVLEIISSIIKDSVELQQPLTLNEEFFDLGVDSSASVRIRSRVQQQLIPRELPQLPLNVLYDCGNLLRLTDFICAFRKGENISGTHDTKEIELMHRMVSDQGLFASLEAKDEINDHAAHIKLDPGISKDVVLVTGVTGTLGAQVLALLRRRTPTIEIHCLIRAASPKAAYERAARSLQQRKLPGLDEDDSQVHLHPCQLSQTSLGLSPELYATLAGKVTVIIHAAWAVNFTMRLSSFAKDHILGLRNLLRFALFHRQRGLPPQFLFCSSTASALGPNTKTNPIPERISHDPLIPAPMGYSRSKWVAEAICEQAHLTTSLRDHIKILRIGQLCGDTQQGVWNVTEAWPLMLSSSRVTECFPDLGRERLNWLPVDIAAEAVLEFAFQKSAPARIMRESGSPNKASSPMEPCPVYHIVNNSRETTWSDLLGWLQRLDPKIKVVPPAQWILKLDQLQQDGEQHPALKLLDMWRKNYGGDDSGAHTQSLDITFDMTETEKASPTMRNVAPIGEQHFVKIWEWLQQELDSGAKLQWKA